MATFSTFKISLSLNIHIYATEPLNVIPKSVQPKMKAALQDIWMAETRQDALDAYS
jgi:hypothetical protein